MGDLHELFDLTTIGHIFNAAAIAGPVVGVVIGGMAGVRNKSSKRGMMYGLLWGLAGVLNWLLWRIYNAITDRNGLDTVKNLAINLAVFVFAGLLMGFGVARFHARGPAHTDSSP